MPLWKQRMLSRLMKPADGEGGDLGGGASGDTSTDSGTDDAGTAAGDDDAGTGADPQASAQPLDPWPRLSQTPSTPLGPITGGPSGSIGRAPCHCTAWLMRAAPGNQFSSAA